MRARIERLDRRDQLLLLLLGLLVSGALLYLIVWAPLTRSISRYESSNASAQRTLEWMREASGEIQQLRAGAGGSASGQSLSTVVDASLPLHGLVMQRFQPVGEGAAQVWLEEAPVAQVIAWLAALESGQGMRLESVSMVAADKQGQVKTRLRLSRP